MADKTKISDWYGLKLDKERLIEFSRMPIVSRLEWLEEANGFLNSITDPECKKRWQLQREHKI